MTYNAGIVGANGYTGLELCRLLSAHPRIHLTRVFSRQLAGQRVGDVFPHLFSIQDLVFEAFDPSKDYALDVIFLALPHATSHEMLPQLRSKIRYIIDLSADYRLSDLTQFSDYYGVTHASPELVPEAVYGIPELYRDRLKGVTLCANPGCYATCVILGLHPLVKAGFHAGPIIVDAKSGVSGAGKSLKEASLFCEVNEDFAPYSTYRHRHVPEMESQLGTPVLFSPHLVPMSRGMLASSYITLQAGVTESDIAVCFSKAYGQDYFVHLVKPNQMHTKFVTGTNHVMISWKYCPEVNQVVVFSMLDNLLKGASGQAVQNMNVMLGFSESLGLEALSALA